MLDGHLEQLRAVLSQTAEIGGPAEAAAAAAELGEKMSRGGEHALAAAVLKEGLPYAERAPGGAIGVAVFHRNIAEHLRTTDEPDEAIHHAARAARIYAEYGIRDGEVACTRSIARCLRDLGRFAEAREYFREAAEGYESAGALPARTRCWHDGALCSIEMGRAHDARELLLRVVAETRRAGEVTWLADALCDLGLTHVHEGRLDKAEQRFREAMAVAPGSDASVQATQNLGRLHQMQGRFDQARALYDQVLDARPAPPVPVQANLGCNLAAVFEAEGDPERALRVLECVVALLPPPDRRALAEQSMGRVLLGLGRVEEARHHLSWALEVHRGAGQATEWCLDEVLMARAHAALGDPHGALALAERAAARAGDLGLDVVRLECDRVLADIARSAGDFAREREVLESCCARSESLRPTAGGDPLGVASGANGLASAHLSLCARALWPGREWTALFETMEGVRSRTLRDLTLRRREAAEAPDAEPLVAPPVGLEDTLAALPSGAAMIYLCALPGVEVALVLCPGQDPIGVALDPLAAEHLTALLELVAGGHPTDAFDAALGEMYAAWVSPWIDHLPRDVGHLVFVPHQRFHHVPWHALWRCDGGERRYLVEDYFVSFAPSASLFVDARARPRCEWPESVLAVLDPRGDLPAARDQALDLLASFPRRTLLGAVEREPASRANLLRAARSAELVLCIGHGVGGDAARSHLMLRDGPFSLPEQLHGLRLERCWLWDSDACETARPQLGAADEWLSLAAPPLVAGAATVWANLWAVDDAVAVELKRRAYSGLVAGVGRARALCEAQRALIGGRQYSAAHHWAPFVSVGDI